MTEKNKNESSGRQKERKSNRLNLRITDSEIESLNFVSFKDDEPVSQIVRKAIKMYVSARQSTY